MKFLMSLVIMSLFLGCQSSPYSSYKKVHPGATKGQVLHMLGSPQRTYRKKDRDHWVYPMRDEAGHQITKEVLFSNGLVVDAVDDFVDDRPKTPNKVPDDQFIPIN